MSTHPHDTDTGHDLSTGAQAKVEAHAHKVTYGQFWKSVV